MAPPVQNPGYGTMPTAENQSESGEASSESGESESGSATVGNAVSSFVNNPFTWGPVVLHPRLGYTFTYGNGIHSRPGEQEKTIIQRVTPSLGMTIGRHWNLNYTPSLSFYSSDEFKDTLDHSVSLSGATSYEDWAFSVSQSYARSSESRVETARQTDQETYSTSLGATYLINSAWSVEMGVSQSFRFTGGGYANAQRDSRNWSTMEWLNYQYSPALGFAVGVGGGYDDVGVGSDMTSETLQGRVTFRVTEKVNLSVNGGGEVRQFLDSEEPDLLSPIFGASISYSPFKVTTISLSGSRSVSSSYFQNQVTENTSVSLGLTQRLFGRYSLGLSGGFSTTDYRASASGLSVSRSDENSFFRVSLGTGFLKRGTVSIFYSVSKNSSNNDDFGYSSDQMGFSLSYGY
ncbi:MAG TPA: hypothetical protein VFW05_17125 [Verrucomicrobiae bacterium]|nr:hypothetical protein [Verrucomicrobiae bacterium]